MAAGVAPYDMDGNRIDDVLNIKGDYVNMCKGAIGIAKDAEKKGMLKGKKEPMRRYLIFWMGFLMDWVTMISAANII